MIDRLEVIKDKYEELQKELTSDDAINDYKKAQSINKEISSLEETVTKYKEYQDISKEIKDLEEMLADPDFAEIAKDELDSLYGKINKLESELELLLIPKDEHDGKDIIMEIRGAAGGDEANIFAGDLFRMYSRYAESKKWKIDVNNALEGTSGGFTQIELSIRGENVYSELKFESGAHRVQRIPTTETQGRVHTSTATVVVMPEVEDVEIEIKNEGLRIDVYRSGGKGGQSVNTTDSAVRITHLPTGIVVTCQNERSQIKNKDRAMKVLKVKLYDLMIEEQQSKSDSDRRSKIGTGDRSEKIRTYNYPQNRVTDHRINFSIMQLDQVMDGDLEPIINALIAEDQKRKLEHGK